tara:strand:- start:8327 stop:9229 length:903 start_codon:yes stop_codon:yes gene_type:complete
MTSKKLIYIAGPTGIGKTELSIKIAQKLKTEIISCDSRQFFKEFKIGTSPPSLEQLDTVKHHFIHHKSIHDEYNVGKFEKDAINLIDGLFLNYDNLILVGGSGLYADSILYGIDKFPAIPITIKNTINKKYKEKGIEYLQKEIKKLDPEYYGKVDKKNSRRLIRALEVIESSGKSFTSFRKANNKERIFSREIIIINCDREILYSKIDKRVDRMIMDGLENEVYSLKEFKNLNTLNTVGYKEFINYFENKISYNEAVKKIKQNTRNYAKRQITWNKKYSDAKKIDISENITANINKILQI